MIILGYKYAKQGFVATLPYSGLKMDFSAAERTN